MIGGCLVLAGCGVVNAVKNATHTVEGNRSTIDAFTGKMQSGETAPFEATYVTTGAAPATIVYAVQPPKGLAFTDLASSGAVNADIIVNSSGEYSCSRSSSGSGSSWTCLKLAGADAAAENKIFDLYTPSHWIAFLKGFSLVEGLVGDKVTSSTMSVNGFSMQCVDVVATGIAGTSTICTTAQGILGYVKVASNATSFEIKSYSASPSSSLFQLPAGATITTVPATTQPQGAS